MNTLLIDTLEAKKELTKAGVKAKEAEAIVKVMSAAHDQVATKADIGLLQKEIENLETRLLIKIPGIIFLGLGLFKYFAG